jgi:hypothetical protein
MQPETIVRALLLMVVCCLALAQRAGAEPGLRVVRDKSGHAAGFEASGLAEEKLANLSEDSLGQVLAVYVVDKHAKDVPPLLGKYEVDEDTLRFTPRYALRPGTRYRAVLQPEVVEGDEADPAKGVTLEIALPAPKRAAATVVTHVYPSSDRLPENQLRFYLHFSQPMARGEAYEHLKLLKENGEAVELPFLELGEELWDTSGKRLTLLIDPGRIKRGLKPREDVGPVLEAGQSYTLAIDAAWKDAAGEPLKTGHAKKFMVGKPVEVGIDPADWKIDAPPAGSRQALVVRFPRPLDHALLQWTMEVLDSAGQSLTGEIAVSDEEQQWSFTPEQAWTSGKFALEVDNVLEDLTGNRIGRAFELAEGETAKQKGPKTVRIPFTVAVPQR